MTNPAEHIDAVIKAIEYMKKNIDDELTSEKLAEVAGYSPYHFSRVFKEVTGVSPRYYLSALRIETGKEILIESSSHSMLKVLMQIGFKSMGTFSAKFKQFVGLSPKQFQSNVWKHHQFMNDMADAGVELYGSTRLPAVYGEISVPANFKGLIFIGLFPRPIPDQRPVVGIAIRHSQKEFVFSGVPNGTYYALAAAIPWSLNPRDYFLLSSNLRGKAEEPVEIFENTICKIHIKLREPLPYDPPILINLPKLLLEKDSKLEEK